MPHSFGRCLRVRAGSGAAQRTHCLFVGSLGERHPLVIVLLTFASCLMINVLAQLCFLCYLALQGRSRVKTYCYSLHCPSLTKWVYLAYRGHCHKGISASQPPDSTLPVRWCGVPVGIPADSTLPPSVSVGVAYTPASHTPTEPPHVLPLSVRFNAPPRTHPQSPDSFCR